MCVHEHHLNTTVIVAERAGGTPASDGVLSRISQASLDGRSLVVVSVNPGGNGEDSDGRGLHATASRHGLDDEKLCRTCKGLP